MKTEELQVLIERYFAAFWRERVNQNGVAPYDPRNLVDEGLRIAYSQGFVDGFELRGAH